MPNALTFAGAATTDNVNDGVIVAATNMAQYWVACWVRCTSFVTNRVLWAKGGGNAKFFREVGVAGDIQGGLTRLGGNTTYSTTDLPLVLNTWCFVAMVVDVNAGAGLKVQFYAGLEGVPAVARAIAITTETGTTPTDDTGLSMFWGNNSALTNGFQGDIAYGAVFPGLPTLADIQSYQAKPRQVVRDVPAHVFKHFGIAAADAFDFAGNAAGTVTGATQTNGPNTALVVSKYTTNRSLLTAMGLTDAQAFDVHDSRMCMLNDRTKWYDSMAPIAVTNGRAKGVELTAVNVPTVTAEGVVFDGVNDQYTSAQDPRIVFDAATALHFLGIVKISGNGPLFGAAQDPANAALFPIAYAQGAAGTIKGFYNPTGAGTGPVTPITGVATGGVVRALVIGRYARDGGTNNGDDGWHFSLIGQQGQLFQKNTAATTVAGGLREFIGGFGGTFASCTFYHKMTVAADLTGAAIAAYAAFGLAEFGAITSGLGQGTFKVTSHSWGVGTQTTDPLTPTVGSGTTAFSHLVGSTVTAKGSIANQFGLVTNKQWISGVGGRTMDQARIQYPHESAWLLDGLRSGPNLDIVLFWTNDERNLTLTLAQMKTAAAAYYTAMHAAGWYVVLVNAPPYGSGLAGAANGCYANASPDPTIGSEGTVMQGMNTELSVNPTPYCDHLITITGDAVFTYNPRATANLTFWNADETHPKDPGHVVLANLILNDIIRSGLIWPYGQGNRKDYFGSFRFRPRGRSHP